MRRRCTLFVAVTAAFVASLAVARPEPADLPLPALVDRLTWGATPHELARARELGPAAYIQAQLHPAVAAVPPGEVLGWINELSISQQSAHDALIEARAHQLSARRMADGPEKVAALKSARRIARTRASETVERSIWLALYSPNQLQEQMTWFWTNHFSIYARKGNVGAVLDDYETRAVRPRALGKFRDLLEATMRSPAMLLYLDNQANRADSGNENYARELMELHTLGVNGGYTQKDVQELARILTGLGVSYSKRPPRIDASLRVQVVQDGAFLFNPAKHDYGDKVLLGHRIKGRGLAEVEEAADILARHPATARHISLKLAQYFVADQPPEALVDTMAKTFQASDGDISQTLQVMFRSSAFAKSLQTGKFKDPVHYVYSAVRLAYAGLPPVSHVSAVKAWLTRMGQPLYGRVTPDGYPLAQSDWSGSGQMTIRFDAARQIATRPQTFYRSKNKSRNGTTVLPPVPRLLDAYRDTGLFADLSPKTREVIEQAESVRDSNTYLLASPEFMRR
ncbi:DUF1800 domain-containing protein [Bordetella petrii]|uniref:DUF1800 domain-containing protein n=1 Tax=Bordetella petrii TaxID=94624 RepID=UPI0038B3E4D5